MFNLKKVKKARKRLTYLTSILFKLFQINLRYKENRKDYGIEIFEYFYLPWNTSEEFNLSYDLISNHTLNPKSRLYTLYDMSKRYLKPDTSFIEVGCWKGGATGLVILSNKNKNIDYYACDTFSGVVNTSDKDSFFKGKEYDDTNINNINEIEGIVGEKIQTVQGIFPNSMKEVKLDKPISFAHIDVDTYISAKESLEFISANTIQGALVILDDFGGWFTDGVTKLGNELKSDKRYFVAPNHLGQLLIYKI
jgi:O-methyltransferase|tara:strand:+ start:999 stop:1751 length:753 start_codon:yes stop_codon:yes gene_type:complete